MDGGYDEVVEREQLFLFRRPRRLESAERVCKLSRRLFAYPRDADREQKAFEFGVFGCGDRGEYVGDLLVLEAFKVSQVVGGKRIQVGKIAYLALRIEQLERLVRKPLDVHRVAADEVRKARHERRLARLAVRAIGEHASDLDRASARRADSGHFDLDRVLGLFGDAGDLGNDVVGTADEHPAAYPDVLAAYLGDVVERRAADGDAADVDGVEHRERIELARARHLPYHISDDGGHLLCRELERHRPAGELLGVAQLFAH